VQLICCYFSPLLVDTLKKHAMEGDVAVECVYFALAALEEQAPGDRSRFVLKQGVDGLGEVPEKSVKAFRG